MLQARRLLCLVSEGPSSTALQQAASLVCALGASLHVVPVGDPPPSSLAETLHERMPSDCRDSVDVYFAPGLRNDPDLVEALRRYTEEHAIDLVVTDTPSDRGPVPPLAAPTTQSIIEGLDCSVFVVERESDLPSLPHILIPTDLSAATQPALQYATTIAEAYDGAIDLLHVIEGVPYVALTPLDRLSLSDTSFPERRARRRLASFLEDLPERTVPLESHFAYGAPPDQIGRFVNEQSVDLMILSSTGRHATTRSSLGPVADRVLRRVTCPILLVRSSSCSQEQT